jgi:hypothetical protein
MAAFSELWRNHPKVKGDAPVLNPTALLEPGEQGSHIDLWNGSRLTDWTSWIRIHANMNIPGVWSDYKNAKSVWFWPVL